MLCEARAIVDPPSSPGTAKRTSRRFTPRQRRSTLRAEAARRGKRFGPGNLQSRPHHAREDRRQREHVFYVGATFWPSGGADRVSDARDRTDHGRPSGFLKMPSKAKLNDPGRAILPRTPSRCCESLSGNLGFLNAQSGVKRSAQKNGPAAGRSATGLSDGPPGRLRAKGEYNRASVGSKK